jgi:hypothetical protein
MGESEPQALDRGPLELLQLVIDVVGIEANLAGELGGEGAQLQVVLEPAPLICREPRDLAGEGRIPGDHLREPAHA